MVSIFLLPVIQIHIYIIRAIIRVIIHSSFCILNFHWLTCGLNYSEVIGQAQFSQCGRLRKNFTTTAKKKIHAYGQKDSRVRPKTFHTYGQKNFTPTAKKIHAYGQKISRVRPKPFHTYGQKISHLRQKNISHLRPKKISHLRPKISHLQPKNFTPTATRSCVIVNGVVLNDRAR